MATTTDRSPEYNVVGTRPVRHDGVDKVTGRAKFGADVHAVDLLHGKVLRSPHAHARIKSIDTSKAMQLPGVKAVVTSADLPEPPNEPVSVGEGPMVNLRYISSNVLARGKVLYKGHPVAAVAAESPHIAEEALDLIKVDYEVLPPVMTAFESMQDGAPILHDAMTTMSMGKDTGKNSNVAVHTQFSIGDADEAFKDADVIIERSSTPRPSTRATSSRRTPLFTGPATARSPSGPATRGTSACGRTPPLCWACPYPRYT